MDPIERMLEFLCNDEYAAQLKGKTWVIGIAKHESPRLYKLGFEVVFTPEMVHSILIMPNHLAIIELVH